jgi:hypothetical protein
LSGLSCWRLPVSSAIQKTSEARVQSDERPDQNRESLPPAGGGHGATFCAGPTVNHATLFKQRCGHGRLWGRRTSTRPSCWQGSSFVWRVYPRVANRRACCSTPQRSGARRDASRELPSERFWLRVTRTQLRADGLAETSWPVPTGFIGSSTRVPCVGTHTKALTPPGSTGQACHR